MAVELRRSSEFSGRELAAIFTASYQDYFVPFRVDEETLDYMVDVFDLCSRTRSSRWKPGLPSASPTSVVVVRWRRARRAG